MKQNILDDLKFRFETLQKSADEFSVKERLSSAQAIRDEITNDQELTNLCNSNLEMARERTELLSSIKLFIDKVIKDTSVDMPFYAAVNEEVKDFVKAKNDLLKLVDSELDSSLDEDTKKYLTAMPEWNTHLETLKAVKRDCSEGRFTIMLMGEYQSGKTTTIEALCDGHHIGKIGDGNATTAIPMSISYSNSGDSYVNITWKTNDELKSIISHLGGYIEGFRIEEIDNPESRRAWMEKIDSLREAREVQAENIRLLAIMSITLKYYGTKEIEECKTKEYSISDIPQLSSFPVNFDSRWSDRGASGFSINEVLFAFINKIVCCIPSSTLQELNCEVFDCPGLFHDQYDTNVTVQLMAQVNTIVFILPYHKKMGDSVIGALQKIKKDYSDVRRKLFIVQNVSRQLDNAFVDANISKVKEIFGDDIDVLCYDANLAYLGKIDRLIAGNLLTEDDRINFCKPVEVYNPINKSKTERIFKDVDEAMQYKLQGYIDIDKNDIITESGFKDLISSIRLFINNNKAYSLIFSDGINKMHNELFFLKSEIRRRHIEPYMLNTKDIKEKYDNRRSGITSFMEYAQEQFNAIFKNDEDQSLSKILTNAIHKKLFTEGFYEDVAKSIATIMYENKFELAKKAIGSKGAGLINKLSDKFKLSDKLNSAVKFDEDALNKYITPLVKNMISDKVKNKIKYWNTIVSNNEDTTFNEYFNPQMRSLELNLQNKWIELFGSDSEFRDVMNRFISIPRSITGFNLRDQANDYAIMPVNGTETISVALDSIMNTITTVTLGITAAITTLIVAGTSNPVGWVIIIAAGLGAIIIPTAGKQKLKEEFLNEMEKEIINSFKEKNFDEIIHDKLVKTSVSGYLNNYLTQLEKQKDNMSIIIDNEREVALNTPNNEREGNCFNAVASIDLINARLKGYSNFKKAHSTDEHD